MPKTRRHALATDPHVGAGNVVGTLAAWGESLDEPAVAFDTSVPEAPAEQPLTLRELDLAVAARAAWLHDRGVRPRSPVAVRASGAADVLLAFLALARLGAIPALVSARLDPRVAASYIDRLGAEGTLVDDRAASELAAHACATPQLGRVDELAQGRASEAPPPYRHHPDDPVLISHSSGTTGVPKAVISTHGSLFAGVRHRLGLPRPRGFERVLCALPPAHNSAVTALNLSLCTGAPILMLSAQEGRAIIDAAARWRPSAVAGFAVTWAELAASDPPPAAFESVSVWWNSGDCAHEPHVRKLIALGHREVLADSGVERRPGSRFVDGLGSSEMGHALFYNVHEPDTDRYDRCIGWPHGFATVAVLTPEGEEVGDGEIGLLGVRSPSVTPGYWNDSVTTYRSLLRGWFLTGDLVYRDAEGRYYHLDRATDAVDGGDQRLYTALIEERILARCRDVADCTVVAAQVGGDVRVDVFLRLLPGVDDDPDRAETVAQAFGDQRHLLRRVTAVGDDDLPLGPTGKVRKRVLRERLQRTLAEGRA